MTNPIRFTLGLNVGDIEPNAKRAEDAIKGIGTAGQTSARQIAAATRGLPAQFTDIATQLAGGQNPFLVLLQQGGQIKDQFGGVGAALRGVASTITPFTVAVGGAAAVAGTLIAALFQANTESSRLRDTLLLTGNAAGLTAGRVDELAARVEAATLQTIAGSREIVTALAATGQTSSQVLEGQAKVVGRIADLSGKAGKEIAASFAGQLEAPAKFAARLNEAYNFLTVAQFKRIQALELEGKAAEAVSLTNDTLLKALDKQRQNLGTLESAWIGVGNAASGAWDFMLGLGRAETSSQQLQSLARQIEANARREDRADSRDPASGRLREGADAQRSRLIADYLRLAEQIKQEGIAASKVSEEAAKARKGVADALGAGARKEPPPVFYDVLDANDGRLKLLKAQEEGLSAIRDSVDQYRTDFMRSEVQAYAELAKLTDEQESDNERRTIASSEFLQGLADANRRATAELIADERERGLALIEIDRDIAQRRIRAAELTGSQLRDALTLVDESAALSQTKLDRGIAEGIKSAADSSADRLTDSIATGILEGFRKGSSFADIFLNELKAQFAKTVLTPLIRPAVDAGNSVLQDIFKGILGAITGQVNLGTASGADLSRAWDMGSVPGRARGGPVRAGSTYLVGERGPELLRMGPQSGTVIPNSALGGGGVSLTNHIHIDARSDQAAVMQLVAEGVQQGNRAMMDHLGVMGVVAR